MAKLCDPPLIADTIRWDMVSKEWNYAARDGDGSVWLHKDKPAINWGEWLLNNGENRRIDDIVRVHTTGTVRWQDSLLTRPGVSVSGIDVHGPYERAQDARDACREFESREKGGAISKSPLPRYSFVNYGFCRPD